MDSNHYFELKIKSVDASVEDVLVHDLFEIGASGVQENLVFSQKDKKFMPEVIEQNSKDLIAYFESKPSAELVEKLLTQYPALEFEINEMPIKDWLAEWKASWSPFELVESFWVVPEWERADFNRPDTVGIYIEPGMAFGTGTHATTQLAASLIKELSSQTSLQSALDVGTGSGILTLLLAKLGVPQLSAYDNDPESQRVFLENLQKNNCQAQWVSHWQSELQNKVDLCVANIIDGVLLELKPAFKSIGASHYIFTGVLQEREKYFLQEMTNGWDLQLVTRVQKEEWVGFLFEGES